MEPDGNEHLRQATVTTATACVKDFPNLRVLRTDLPFYKEDGSIRYFEGREFFYADANHLTDVGAEQGRDIIRKAIFDAVKQAETVD